ncbi:MAG: HlyD family efflux transporter periplasmic adaptor subunit [Gammaproteobacteria bacterium]|jgi:HlyD family secretion protein
MKFKLLQLAGTLLFFGILIISGCSKNNHNQFQGYIEGRFTYISSQYTGTLQELSVERGSKLKIGQKIAVLESSPQLEEYQQAQADLEKAKSDLADLEKGKRPSELAAIVDQQKQVIAQIEYAAVTVKRYQHLVKTDAIQQDRLDEAISNYNNLNAQLAELNENLITAKLPSRIDQINAAKAAVSAAKAAMQKAQWQLNQKQLFSPLNGHVYDTFYRIGENVPANTPVLSALDPKNVYVVFFIPEKKLATIKIGQKITFTCDSCPQSIPATIYFISDKAEYTPPVIYSENSRQKLTYRVEAKLTIANAQKVNPGQPITIDLANTE